MRAPRRIGSALRWTAIVLLLPVMGGCADVGGGPIVAQVTELRRLDICGSDSGAAAVTLFADTAQLRVWQQQRGIDLIGDGALPAGPYAVIEHGARNTGGYAVVPNRRASIGEGVLVLSAKFNAPDSSLRAQVLTSPCVLMALPRGDYIVVEVIDAQGYLRASSNEPPPRPASRAQ